MAEREAVSTRLIEAVPAIFMVVVSAAIIVGTGSLRYWDGTTPGSRFLPLWLAGAGLLLAMLLFLTLRRGTDGGSLDLPDRFGARRVALTFAGLVALALLTPIVGMLPMIGLFMFLMLTLVLSQRLVPSLIATAVVVLGVEIIFVRWLSVPLPSPFGF